MDDVQFFDAQDIEAQPPSEHVITLRVRANNPVLVGRVLDDVEELISAMTLLFEQTPGVSVDIEAPGFTKAFYGYEVDVWRKK